MFTPTPVASVYTDLRGDPDDARIMIESAGDRTIRITHSRESGTAASLIVAVDAEAAWEIGAELQRRSVLAMVAGLGDRID
jgi:hypothetical protein